MAMTAYLKGFFKIKKNGVYLFGMTLFRFKDTECFCIMQIRKAMIS